jgi:hypothetical protein
MTRGRASIVAITVFVAVLSVCPCVLAQETVSDVVAFLVTNQAVVTADFNKDLAAAEAARATISRALLIDLTSVPLATASSGFLYRLNPQLGTVERATESFGGFFVERALTAGRGRASFGVSATTLDFHRLNGRSLTDGTFVTVANRFRDEATPFDTESLTLHIRSSTMTLFGSVGVTDRIEIGAAVPLVRLTLDGQRINVYRGTTFLQASGTANASGVADIAIRAKVTALALRGGGVAVAGEVRLPTGDPLNLLGTGSTSIRVMGIGSLERGPVAFHGNAAIVDGGVSSEIDFGGAMSVAVHPRVTVSGEVLTRHVSELHDIDLLSAPHPTIAGVDTLRLSAGQNGALLASAVAGVKWNVTRTMVIGGHVTWALVDKGLTAPLTPTLAFEYSF